MSRFRPSESAIVCTTPRSIPMAGSARGAMATSGSSMRKQMCQPSGSFSSRAPVMRPWQASVVTGMGRVHRNFTRPTNRTVTSPQRRFTRTTRRSAACGMSTAIRAVRCLNLGGPDSSLKYRSQAPRNCRRTCWLACAGNCASHSHPGSGRERASRSCRSISWGDGRLATLPPLPPQPCHSWRRFQSARAVCPCRSNFCTWAGVGYSRAT